MVEEGGATGDARLSFSQVTEQRLNESLAFSEHTVQHNPLSEIDSNGPRSPTLRIQRPSLRPLRPCERSGSGDLPWKGTADSRPPLRGVSFWGVVFSHAEYGASLSPSYRLVRLAQDCAKVSSSSKASRLDGEALCLSQATGRSPQPAPKALRPCKHSDQTLLYIRPSCPQTETETPRKASHVSSDGSALTNRTRP